MNSLWKKNEFCRDLLETELATLDRERLVSRMAHRAPAARRRRSARLGGAVLLLSLFSLAWQHSPPGAVHAGKPSLLTQIHSQPFKAVIRSAPVPEAMIIPTTAADAPQIVHTEHSSALISDEQLLQLLDREHVVALLKEPSGTVLQFLDE
jgi:hypothetical protein